MVCLHGPQAAATPTQISQTRTEDRLKIAGALVVGVLALTAAAAPDEFKAAVSSTVGIVRTLLEGGASAIGGSGGTPSAPATTVLPDGTVAQIPPGYEVKQP